jgi:hypothetical protein
MITTPTHRSIRGHLRVIGGHLRSALFRAAMMREMNEAMTP